MCVKHITAISCAPSQIFMNHQAGCNIFKTENCKFQKMIQCSFWQVVAPHTVYKIDCICHMTTLHSCARSHTDDKAKLNKNHRVHF